MKIWVYLFGVLSFIPAHAETSQAIIPSGLQVPQNQKVAAIDYFSDGRQTGCGLRATGETDDNVWLNVLVTVFRKETGATFGVLKVVARKAIMKDGEHVLKDGKMTFSDTNKVWKAWIRSDSGKQPWVYKDGQSMHSDAYMVDTEFNSTVELMMAIAQENFKVGINRNGFGPDQVFRFDKPIEPAEAGKLNECLDHLKAAIEASKRKDSF